MQILKVYVDNRRLRESSSYSGYEVLLQPFTATDTYNYIDAFFLGLKLSAWYDYSDACLNNIAFMLDDVNYFQNNVTLVPKTTNNETEFNIALNFTGMMGGNMS